MNIHNMWQTLVEKALFADSGWIESFIHFCFYVLKVNNSPEDVTMAQPTDHPKPVSEVLRAYMQYELKKPNNIHRALELPDA